MTEQRPRIVVGVDGSASSKTALRWAGRMAAAERAGLDVIAAWELPPSVGWYALPPGFSPEADLDQVLAASVDEVFGANRPPQLRMRSLEGPPAQILLTAGRGARMIVVGSRGHGGFAGLLLGSVSSKVAEHATCPVLVVHGDAPEPLLDEPSSQL